MRALNVSKSEHKVKGGKPYLIKSEVVIEIENGLKLPTEQKRTSDDQKNSPQFSVPTPRAYGVCDRQNEADKSH